MPARLSQVAAFALCTLLAPAPAAASGAIEMAIGAYNALADESLPVPTTRELARIQGGETVIRRERTPIAQADGTPRDRIRVVGYQRVPRPRLLVWLATLDIGTQHSGRLVEHLLEIDDAGGSTWYQFLDTPWPVSNRHWVIRNRKSIALTDASAGLIWEHNWRLAPGGELTAGNLLRSGRVLGLTERDGERAIYLSVNRGAWTMLRIDEDTTLVVAHTAAVMGGWIPDSWVARFVAGQLGEVLGNLESRTDAIHERYTARYPVFSGAGRQITPDMARMAHDRYASRIAIPSGGNQ